MKKTHGEDKCKSNHFEQSPKNHLAAIETINHLSMTMLRLYQPPVTIQTAKVSVSNKFDGLRGGKADQGLFKPTTTLYASQQLLVPQLRE